LRGQVVRGAATGLVSELPPNLMAAYWVAMARPDPDKNIWWNEYVYVYADIIRQVVDPLGLGQSNRAATQL